jgi:hypothetical protein
MPSKRSPTSKHLPPSKRGRTQLTVPNLPPTPENLTGSATSSRLLSVERKAPAGPACPGIVRTRGEGPLLRLPPDSDALETFANLRKDNISDEEAFLKFIATYDVPLATLNRISTIKLKVSFSKVKYKDVAPYVWLNPDSNGRDICQLDAFRSRIPRDIFQKIYADVNKAALQYGRMISHDNEEARSRFISSFFSEILYLFGNRVINKPEGVLDAQFTKRGRIEHHFYTMDSVSVVFIEIKKIYTLGSGRLDIIAEVLAECDACDYVNSKSGHWLPILAILCDGEKFDFIVYDSGIKSIYSSEPVTGLIDMKNDPGLFLSSLKRTTEFIFDYFLMAYINGLRSFGHKSELAATKSKSKKRESTEKWIGALAKAEYAHMLCREAADLAHEGMTVEAEETAIRGIKELEGSVLEVPGVDPDKILIPWDENVVMNA